MNNINQKQLSDKLDAFCALLKKCLPEAGTERCVLFSGIVLALAGLRPAGDLDFSTTVAGLDDSSANRIRAGLAELNRQTIGTAKIDGTVLEDLTPDRKAFLLKIIAEARPEQESRGIEALVLDPAYCETLPNGLKVATLTVELIRRRLRLRPRCWSDLLAAALIRPQECPLPQLPHLPETIVYEGWSRGDAKSWSRAVFIEQVAYYLKRDYGIKQTPGETAVLLQQPDKPLATVRPDGSVGVITKGLSMVLFELGQLVALDSDGLPLKLHPGGEELLAVLSARHAIGVTTCRPDAAEIFNRLTTIGVDDVRLFSGPDAFSRFNNNRLAAIVGCPEELQLLARASGTRLFEVDTKDLRQLLETLRL